MHIQPTLPTRVKIHINSPMLIHIFTGSKVTKLEKNILD